MRRGLVLLILGIFLLQNVALAEGDVFKGHAVDFCDDLCIGNLSGIQCQHNVFFINSGERNERFDVVNSLFGKELSRFLNTPIYLLNSGLGILIAPVGAVIALIKRADIHRVLGAMNMPEQVTLILPVMITATICLVYSMDNLTAPSVSLEGKSLWILRFILFSIPFPR